MTILIVDDHPQVRAGMRALLESAPDMDVLAGASTRKEARKLLQRRLPDLLVTDLSLPEGSGLDLIRWARDRWPELPILVVSTHEKAVYAPKVREAGADGYLVKTEAASHLPEAARRAVREGSCLSDAMSGAGPDEASANPE